MPPPLIVSAFSFIASHQNFVCAVLTHSRHQFNSSSVPSILQQSHNLWIDLGERLSWGQASGKHEERLLKIFSLSDTMQWTSTIWLHAKEFPLDFLLGIFERLINKNRYFCRSLKTLRTQNGGKALAQVCNSVTSLEELNLDRAEITSEDLTTSVAKCIHLRKLNLSSVQEVKDQTLIACILQMKSLRQLILDRTRVTDRGVSQLIPLLPSLQELSLLACPRVSGRCLEPISASTSLLQLTMGVGSAILDMHLKCFENVDTTTVSLQCLNFRDAYGITTEGLVSLVPVLSLTLRELNLRSFQQLSDDAVEVISRLPLLTTLILDGVKTIGDASCQHLTKLQHLETLNLGFSVDLITDAGLQSLSKITTLRKLDVSRCAAGTEVGFLSLCSLTQLCELNVFRCCITDRVLEAYSTSLKKLNKLDISSCESFSDQGLKYVSDNMKNLEDLNISHNEKQITDAGLKHLESLTGLKEISVFQCQNLTLSGVKSFRKTLPHLQFNWNGTKL